MRVLEVNSSVAYTKLHNEELHDLYSSPSIIRMIKSRRMRWAGHVARRGHKRTAHRSLVRKPDGKRPKNRRVTDIKMELVEIGWGGVEWIDLAQDRNKLRAVVIAVMNYGFYKMMGKLSISAQFPVVSQSASQPVSQSASQPVSQSASQSVSQSVSQSSQSV
jgi:hypothetical protein